MAREVSEVKPYLSGLVSKLFVCLRQMVRGGQIRDAESLGIALGAVFDLCLSLLYAERVANTGWLYCPSIPTLSFYPYIKSCPRCGKYDDTTISVSHKPPSDTIGRYTTACLGAILSEACRVARNGFKVRFLHSSQGDVDMLIFDRETVILCEVKASPLYLLPLCVLHKNPLEDENGPVLTHRITDIPDMENKSLYLHLIGELRIPLGRVRSGDSRGFVLRSGRENLELCEILKAVIDTWTKMYEGYTSRWSLNERLRWFTCGCGGGVDDSKNAPGLDRTDDIKKGVYQMLKIAEKYRKSCKEKRVRVALLSNIHPVVHYEEYLKGFEDALWTHEADIQERHEGMVFIDSNLLLPFYDMLFTLTRAWFREERLKQALSLQTLYYALGGSR